MGAVVGWSYTFTLDYVRTYWNATILPVIKAGKFPLGLNWADQTLMQSIALAPVVASEYTKSIVEFCNDLGPPYNQEQFWKTLYPSVDLTGHNVKLYTGQVLSLDQTWDYVNKPHPKPEDPGKAVLNGIRDTVNTLTGIAGDGIRNVLGGATKAVGEGLNNVGEGIGKAAEGLGKGVGGAVSGAGAGLGNAFSSLALPLAAGAALIVFMNK
jgi:hypothetical protein